MKLSRGIVLDSYEVLRITRNCYKEEIENTESVWNYVCENKVLLGDHSRTLEVIDEGFKKVESIIEYLYDKYDCWTKDTCYKRLVSNLYDNINKLKKE